MRYWIVAGGTGGHVYPALAIAQALQDIDPQASLTWIGVNGGREAEWISHTGLPSRTIPAGGLHGVTLFNALLNGWRLTRGLRLARRYMAQDHPDAVFTTGGYVSGPVAVAAKWRRVPLMLYLPDIEPGQAVKAVARHSAKIGVTVAESASFFAGQDVLVSGYPLRRELTRWNRTSGRAALGLPAAALVLLVFGGSLGARSINQALLNQLGPLLSMAEVVHISGQRDWPWVKGQMEKFPATWRTHYHPYAYLNEKMGAALASADLVICRAGASVLGELPYFGLPALLIPYPHAWNYQRVNADWLAKHQAAIVMEDADLPTKLSLTAYELLVSEERRRAMANAARNLAQPDAAQKLAMALYRLGQEASPWSR